MPLHQSLLFSPLLPLLSAMLRLSQNVLIFQGSTLHNSFPSSLDEFRTFATFQVQFKFMAQGKLYMWPGTIVHALFASYSAPLRCFSYLARAFLLCFSYDYSFIHVLISLWQKTVLISEHYYRTNQLSLCIPSCKETYSMLK